MSPPSTTVKGAVAQGASRKSSTGQTARGNSGSDSSQKLSAANGAIPMAAASASLRGLWRTTSSARSSRSRYDRSRIWISVGSWATRLGPSSVRFARTEGPEAGGRAVSAPPSERGQHLQVDRTGAGDPVVNAPTLAHRGGELVFHCAAREPSAHQGPSPRGMTTWFTCGHRGAASPLGPSGLGGETSFRRTPGVSPTPSLTEIATVAVSTASGTTTLMVQVSTFPVSW